MKSYTIEAATTQEAVQNGQCDAIDTRENLQEAKQRAKYLLSDEYTRANPQAQPLTYSRILDNKGVCVADFFKK